MPKRITIVTGDVDNFLKFRKSMISTSKIAPTTLADGKHGHAFLILDQAGYTTSSLAAAPQKMRRPFQTRTPRLETLTSQPWWFGREHNGSIRWNSSTLKRGV